MTPEQFAYWLQGFAEIKGSAPSEKEWLVIKDHLATVFKKITPNYGPGVLTPRDGFGPPYNPNSPFGPIITTPTNPFGRPEVICSVGSNTMDPL